MNRSAALDAALGRLQDATRLDDDDFVVLLDDLTRRQRGRDSREHSSLTDAEAVTLRAVGLDLDAASIGSDSALETSIEQRALLSRALTTKQVAALLHVTEGRVRQRRGERSLLAYAVDGHARYLDVQFTASGELPGWSAIAPKIPEGAHPVAVASFLRLPSVDLRPRADAEPVSPRDWMLSGGDPAQVARLAQTAFGPV